MYYKIGALAKRFGISTQALRFYEQHGLLVADRHEDGGVRRYQARNFKWLYSIRRYHDLGFSMEEILEQFKCRSVIELEESLNSKLSTTYDEMQCLERRLVSLKQQTSDLEQIKNLLHKNETCIQPELLVLVDQNGQSLDLSPDLEQDVEEWMRYLLFVYAASIIDTSVFAHPERPAVRKSGFCIERTVAERVGLNPGAHARVMGGGEVVHTVTQLNRKNPTLDYLLGHSIDYIASNGLAVTGPAIGRCLAKTGEVECKDTLCPESVYYEYWIPVGKKEPAAV